MYQPLLTNRYLTSRVIPLIAVAAVALCVALVIIVVSVMSGFLNMVRESGRKLMGDVVVARPVNGIGYYDDLIDALEARPEIAAATPIIDSWGLIKMPYPHGDAKQTETVQVWGIEPEGFARVTGFGDTMFWQEVPEDQRDRVRREAINAAAGVLRSELSAEERIQLTRRWVQRTSPPDVRINEQLLIEQVEAMPPRVWAGMVSDLTFIDDGTILREVIGEDRMNEIMQRDPRATDPAAILQEGLTLRRNGRSAIVPGLHVSEGNQREPSGEYTVVDDGYWWLPAFDLTLTMMPVDAGGAMNPVSRIFPVANEFKSDVFLIDDTRVFIPLADAQEMLSMNEAERVDDVTFETIGIDPARATMILVRAVEGISAIDLKGYVEIVYAEFHDRLLQRTDIDFDRIPPRAGPGLSIMTWEEQQARFIGPVEKERELMRILFSIVYLVCAGLVLAIFWAIVYEKTRDIGILRSVGASREGVLWIFTRYGLLTSTLGSVLGLGLGVLVVKQINPIKDVIAHPPVLLAISSLVPCALALVLLFLRGGRRSAAFLSLNVLTLVVVGLLAIGILIVIATVTEAALIDLLQPFLRKWEFLLGTVVLVLLGALFAFSRLIRSGSLLVTLVSTLVFFLFVAISGVAFLGYYFGGAEMWDPSVYYFTDVPNTPDWWAALGTVFLSITFSVLGASIAAAKAADVDPVEALRYE